MKSLSLYVDKWYIVGAVTTDNTTRPVTLPNKEDRIWLFFHEEKNSISYSKHFRKNYHNKENHYYGDIFPLIIKSDVTYELFGHSQEMKGIFKSANIFDDLRKDVGEESNIDTFVSFSKDIEISSQKIFLDILNAERFSVKEHVASIEHLALEYAKKKTVEANEDGCYLVLNACNENLRYSLYNKQDHFVCKYEGVLKGYGSDMRSRALIEHIVDVINETERLLQTKEEKEAEYLRMMQFVDGWIKGLSTARGAIPITIGSITFAIDPNKTYSVQIGKKIIDDRTSSIVNKIVRVVGDSINSHIDNGQIKGVLFIGSTFTNRQYRTAILARYSLSEETINVFTDSDLSSIVSAYTFIDCKQFSEKGQTFFKDARAELDRIKSIEERKKKQAEADKEDEARREEEREKAENERKFKEAMDKGNESLGNGNYNEASEYFSFAMEYRPDSEEARTKYDDALRKKTAKEVQYENYKKVIQQAKEAFDSEEWEEAKQKADIALTYVPDSAEAKRIKDMSAQKIKHAKDFERYIDRADLFITNRAYDKALPELSKAKLLNLGASQTKEIKDRENQIRQEREAHAKQIKGLCDNLDKAISMKQFDEAIKTCEQLIEIDSQNSNKWSDKIVGLRSQKEEERKAIDKLNKLTKDIDMASFNENWSEVVALCKQALVIKVDDEVLQNKLKLAEAKVEEEKFNKEIVRIENMINQSYFKEARQELSLLQSLNPSSQSKITDLYNLISKKEAEEKDFKEKEIQKLFDKAYNEQEWSKVIEMYDEHPFLSDKVPNRKKRETAVRGSRTPPKHAPKSGGTDVNRGEKKHGDINNEGGGNAPHRRGRIYRPPERGGKQPSVTSETSTHPHETKNTKNIFYKPKR